MNRTNNGKMTAGQVIAEKLKGKNSPSERISVLQEIVKQHKNGGMDARMDIYVQATSMLVDEKSKTKKISDSNPLSEPAIGLVSGKAILGLGGC